MDFQQPCSGSGSFQSHRHMCSQVFRILLGCGPCLFCKNSFLEDVCFFRSAYTFAGFATSLMSFFVIAPM